MNFKTLIRMAKQPGNKQSYHVNGKRVVNADGYVLGWMPDSSMEARDVDDETPQNPPLQSVEATELIIQQLSPPIEEMVKVNSNYLRRAISALETKGNDPVYIQVHSKYLCFAYQVEGEWHRVAVACMKEV